MLKYTMMTWMTTDTDNIKFNERTWYIYDSINTKFNSNINQCIAIDLAEWLDIRKTYNILMGYKERRMKRSRPWKKNKFRFLI